jgi:hypothetical protein
LTASRNPGRGQTCPVRVDARLTHPIGVQVAVLLAVVAALTGG